jgi:hypothetical protein
MDHVTAVTATERFLAAGRATVRRRLLVPVVLAAAGLGVAACGGNASTAPTAQPSVPASSGAAPSGASPVATESAPPGDIPDSTVYIPYRPPSGLYEVKAPEGWARTDSGTAVSFTDKLNTIRVETARAAAAPSVSSARSGEMPQIQSVSQRFALTGISSLSRPAGTVVLIRYSADSQADPVTGKVFTDSVERYEYYRNGTEAIVTLSGPLGADNVDPWRTVTNSFRWLR